MTEPFVTASRTEIGLLHAIEKARRLLETQIDINEVMLVTVYPNTLNENKDDDRYPVSVHVRGKHGFHINLCETIGLALGKDVMYHHLTGESLILCPGEEETIIENLTREYKEAVWTTRYTVDPIFQRLS